MYYIHVQDSETGVDFFLEGYENKEDAEQECLFLNEVENMESLSYSVKLEER